MSMLKVEALVKFESESHLNVAVAPSDARPSDMRSWVRPSHPAASEITLHHFGKIFLLIETEF